MFHYRKPLRPQRRKHPGSATSLPFSLPAPTGGWNARDPLPSMPPSDATVLENFVPRAYNVTLRKGFTYTVTNFGSEPPRTLMVWNGTSIKKLFAVTNDGVYDVTAADGSKGANLKAVTNGYFSWTNFTTPAGDFLIAVNGSDAMLQYDGTTWQSITDASTPAITGVPTSSLTSVQVAARRLWFTRAGSNSVYYLPAASIGGALVEFPLGQVFSKGGTVVAIGTWSVDGGDGQNDLTVFASSEGELAIYKGIDPSSDVTFGKVGVYSMAPPLSSQCFRKYGADLLYLARNGLFPLSLSMAAVTEDTALTKKIQPAFLETIELYGVQDGWSVHNFSVLGFLLVNAPLAAGYSEQFVMNTSTGAWCKFTAIHATGWQEFNKEIYFIDAQGVAKFWQGSKDNGAPIRCKVAQAYTPLGLPSTKKLMKLVQPIVTVDTAVNLNVSLQVDYEVPKSTSLLTPTSQNVYLWDAANWDEALWGGEAETVREWATVEAYDGYYFSLIMELSTAATNFSWTLTNFRFETGGGL